VFVDQDTTYEQIISNYGICSFFDDPVIHNNNIKVEYSKLFDQLIDRIRLITADAISNSQYSKLIQDSKIKKIDGIPETQAFQIFYDYLFIDDQSKKKSHKGKNKNIGDESSTYRDLALKYLHKEQHHTQCNDCQYKMYEPVDKNKLAKIGLNQNCLSCQSKNVEYHGLKCGQKSSANPSCTKHGEVSIVIYIFQTIEPKMRKLKQICKSDEIVTDIKQRISELLLAKNHISEFEETFKNLNY